MINIMYLVLTALLALNVSAEIFNAFKLVDKGLHESNRSLDEANAKLPDVIKERAKKRDTLAVYAERVDPARQYSKELSDYIDSLVQHMIDATGGYRTLSTGETELKGKKDKEITTRYLVDQGRGEELKKKIEEYRQKYLDLLDSSDVRQYGGDIALHVDDQSWRETRDKDSWSDFTFRQMPLAATLPIFTKFKNDAKASEAAILNYLLGKVGGEELVLDQFQVVSSPKKSYVIKGETFTTDIFLSASASAASNTDIDIAVNGTPLAVNDGVAKYSVPTSSTGVKQYTATATVVNPVTGETDTYTTTFEYEVGVRSASVSADKMNVFYIGVDNPVSVSAAGVSSNELRVSGTGSGITLNQTEPGKYNVRVSKPGDAVITVSGGGLDPTNFDFRVKRIPDPVAKLSNESGGTMGNGTFKAQRGVLAVLENFDFDARCDILGFNLVRVAKRQDPEAAINRGASYNSEARALVDKARPGDKYFFENVKAKCPGDPAGRKINDMVFNIR